MVEQKDFKYKSFYTSLFSTNYFFQGVTTSVFTVIIPIHLLTLTGGISASDIAFLASIILIPWALKVFFGILSDKYGTKRFGRRKPYIIVPFVIAGIIWIILSFPSLATPSNALIVYTVSGVLINFGVAIGDTALDGLIIDTCPKSKLGRAQGFCWGMNSVGVIAGGPMLAFLLISFDLVSVYTIFLIIGLAMIFVPFLMLLVNDSIQVPEVKLKLHLKKMFNNSRDWKAYMYSMSRAFLDGVILLLISIYTLIKLSLIKTDGVTLSIEGSNLNVYLYQAYVSLIISVGIIIGAIAGGQIADRLSRRVSVVISVIITVVSLFLLLIDYSIVLVLLFIASLTGASLGWRRSSASAIISEISKEHPEMDSTYFSIAMAFANIGASLGLLLTGIFLNFTQDYQATFLFLALLSLLVLIPLFLMDPKDYEYKINSEA